MSAILFSCDYETAMWINPENMPELQALLVRCVDYYLLVEGRVPGPDAAQALQTEGPPGWDLKNKFMIGIWDQDQGLVGILEGMRDYPEESIFWIGLLLIDPDMRGQGLGRRIYTGFEEWSRSQGAGRIRLGVIEENARALQIWQRQGFEEISRSEPVHLGNKTQVILRMQKRIYKRHF